MTVLGVSLGRSIIDGLIIELVGDVGAGKTTLTKGIALGLGVEEQVQSPSFTISRVYNARDNLRLCHYDFYRLSDAGLMADELSEVISEKNNITVVEWGGAVSGILPDDRLIIEIVAISEEQRDVKISAGGGNSKMFLERLL